MRMFLLTIVGRINNKNISYACLKDRSIRIDRLAMKAALYQFFNTIPANPQITKPNDKANINGTARSFR